MPKWLWLRIVAVGLVLFGAGCSQPSPEIDLDAVRQRVEQEIATDTQYSYRIHELSMEGGWLVLVLDLQTVPPSRDWLANDAKNWAALVGTAKSGEQYVSEILDASNTHLRVSLWTTSGDGVLIWGAYRSSSGWEDGPGAKNLDALK